MSGTTPRRSGPGGGALTTKAALSRWVYLVSALVKYLLTKNIGLNFASPHSLNKAALTAISEAAR